MSRDQGKDKIGEDDFIEAVDMITKATRTANKYLTIIRVTPFVVMSIGAAIIVKELYIVRRFHSLTKIPISLIKKQWSLRATFKGVDPHGDLIVKHQPKIRFWKDWQPDSRLTIRLLGIVHTHTSVTFIKSNIPIDEKITFKPIALSSDNTKLHAVVRIPRKQLLQLDLGRDLVKRGIAFVAPSDDWPKAPHSYDWYVRKIVPVEKSAEINGKGLWPAKSEGVLVRTFRRLFNRF